jgi:hypothetical protein
MACGLGLLNSVDLKTKDRISQGTIFMWARRDLCEVSLDLKSLLLCFNYNLGALLITVFGCGFLVCCFSVLETLPCYQLREKR